MRQFPTLASRVETPVPTLPVQGIRAGAAVAPAPAPARRRAARSSAAATLALAFVMGTSTVAGYHGMEAVTPMTRFDQLAEARAAASNYADATLELAQAMARTARSNPTRFDVAARAAIEGSVPTFVERDGDVWARPRAAMAPDAMISDALSLMGVATERGRAVAVAAGRRERLGRIDPTETGSVEASPATSELRPDGSAPKRPRLSVPRPTEQRIERDNKRGRLVASATPSLLAAPVATTTFEPRQMEDFAVATFQHGVGDTLIANALVAPAPVFAALPEFAPAPITIARDGQGAVVGTMLSAYAPIVSKDYAARARFDALLKREGSSRFVPRLGAKDHAWAARPLPRAVMGRREQHCLATGIYFEARGEPKAGQAAVAQVILNRVRAPAFPNTVCGVVYQNSHWRNRCQFSFTCDGIKDRVRSPRHWRIAKEVAKAATMGTAWFQDVGSSTHYHADYVNPRWNRRMAKVAKIGRHIFYRSRRGGWD